MPDMTYYFRITSSDSEGNQGISSDYSFVTPPEGEKYCELLAVDPKGEGDLTENILWRSKSPILQLLTPVIWEDLLFTVDAKSILRCLDANSATLRRRSFSFSTPMVRIFTASFSMFDAL